MKLFKNKEVQLSVVIITLLLLTFGTVLLYIFNDFAETLNTTQIKQNVAVIGEVAKKFPELETDIVKNYTSGFQEDYAYGKSILQKYSYDESLSIDKNGFVQKDVKQAYKRLIFLITCLFFTLIVFTILIYYKIFKKVRRLSISAEAIIEGQYSPIEDVAEEGEIGLLTHQFNTMSQRLGESVQGLNNEKLFLKRLITDISHQLKTPLASLVMFNDLMGNDKNMSEQDRNTFILESRNQLDRMEWLIKNMLKMAKLEAGVVDFEKENACIEQTLQRSITGLRLVASQKNINIKVAGDGNVSVKHDIAWTTEALSNILKNCIEHSKEGSEINISWEENSVFVQIVIQDNGSGISKEELPKIFDRFYKGTNSCSPTNIGIGLYITKSIIEGQNGSIYAYSQGGNGTKFIVRLMKID